ncbi:MAG: cytochrome C oxidase subunit IV family protein [Leptospiraceae bacterium]|nr:cytochrome C oxidase subunit IV family protein [Leptospiraceae bacterium]MDW8307002.1 cytochrome C oxidase subunit IV family protein [Leptospiraceae bacterium]
MAGNGKSHVKEMALTLAALLILTVITVWAAHVNFGSLAINIVIAVLIATIKVSLVMLFFMHLRWENKLVVAFAILAIPFIILAIGAIIWDTTIRVGVEKVFP